MFGSEPWSQSSDTQRAGSGKEEELIRVVLAEQRLEGSGSGLSWEIPSKKSNCPQIDYIARSESELPVPGGM